MRKTSFLKAATLLLALTLAISCGRKGNGGGNGDDDDDNTSPTATVTATGGTPTPTPPSPATNPAAVNLGTAGDFAILAKAGISTVPTTAITGDIGVSPAAATYITGFSLVMDASNEFSTSSQIVGRAFAADYAPPTPAKMTTAVSDMETAFTDAAGRAPDFIELGAGDVTGMTLYRGVYKWGTGLLMTSDVYLSGSSTDRFIFEIAGDLTVANGVKLHLLGGALPENVVWQVSGFADLGTTSEFKGTILCQTAITLKTGAAYNGRLLAQTAAVMDSSSVTEPN